MINHLMKEIKYIGFYDLPNSKCKRVSALSAINKMDYICNSINNVGFQVHLISPSWMDDSIKNFKIQKTSTIQLNDNKKLTLVSSFGTSNKFTRIVKIIYSLLWLFFWLVKSVKRDEKIIVYHSPWISLPIILAKKLKRFKLILEVEEIYSDVTSLHPYFDKLEKKIFQIADSFLFSSDLLVSKIGDCKKNIIIYGNYNVNEVLAHPINDNKIHLLYAGIIDKVKAGAFNAVESALYLNEDYVLHIIGFGDVKTLLIRINEINKISKCKIIFDGTLSGSDYIKYCQKCHIGLSTQKMDGKYLETSFPSKILSYMGLGLRVVSCGVECVMDSKIGNDIVFYYKDTTQAIAEAIKKINITTPNNNINIIKKLDREFISDLKKLLE